MILLLAKVVAFGFHVAFEQNFGWLYDGSENAKNQISTLKFKDIY